MPASSDDPPPLDGELLDDFPASWAGAVLAYHSCAACGRGVNGEVVTISDRGLILCAGCCEIEEDMLP